MAGTLQVSEVSISNLALSWLGANLITSLDDDTNEAHLCKANYALARDAVLEIRNWSFALNRSSLPVASLPPEELEPHGGYTPFVIPVNFLRVTQLTQADRSSSAVQWYIEGRYLWAAASAIVIQYLVRVEDPQLFSPNFVHALAGLMASDLSVPITGSRDMQSLMMRMYVLKLETAGAYDGMQGKNQGLQSTRLMRVR